uniref:MARVEL domain-containing protein n=1 Tax=Steinernema glaseri TaxID=37863 RepID=A0A1I8A797_9BILA
MVRSKMMTIRGFHCGFPNPAKPSHVCIVFLLSFVVYASTSSILLILIATGWENGLNPFPAPFFVGFAYYVLTPIGLHWRRERLLVLGAFVFFKALFSTYLILLGLLGLITSFDMCCTCDSVPFLIALGVCCLAIFYGAVTFFFYKYYAVVKKQDVSNRVEIHKASELTRVKQSPLWMS